MTRENYILASLSEAARARLASHAETLHLEQRVELYQPEDELTHIYFPHDCLVSHVALLEDGSSVEVGMTGYEGVVGLEPLLSERNRRTMNQLVVQIAGRAARVRTEAIIEEFKRGEDLHRLVLGHTRCFLTQVSQTAISNVRATLERRLCRWLLMAHDRVPGDEIKLTQEFIAQMLGVRRAGVSVAAGILQEMKMLEYRRGHITILDRAALEAIADGSYFEGKCELDDYLNH